LENIDIDKDNLKNIDIDMAILENIDIDIYIDKGILQNIDIDKISYRLGFGISNTPRHSRQILTERTTNRNMSSIQILTMQWHMRIPKNILLL